MNPIALPIPAKGTPEPSFSGVWIPDYVWSDKRLNLTEAVLLSQIIYLSKRSGYCDANNAYWCEFLRMTDRNVGRLIKRLDTLGVLIVKNPTGKNRRLVPVKGNPDKFVAPENNPDKNVPVAGSNPDNFVGVKPRRFIQPRHFRYTNPDISGIPTRTILSGFKIYKDLKQCLKQKVKQCSAMRVRWELIFPKKENPSVPQGQKKENPPKVPGVPPFSDDDHLFREDPLFQKPQFDALFAGRYPELDENHYYSLVNQWAHKDTDAFVKRSNWASVIHQFIVRDEQKGKLKFKSSIQTKNGNRIQPAATHSDNRLRPVGKEPINGRTAGSWKKL